MMYQGALFRLKQSLFNCKARSLVNTIAVLRDMIHTVLLLNGKLIRDNLTRQLGRHGTLCQVPLPGHAEYMHGDTLGT